MKNEGRVLSRDIHPHKIRLVSDAAKRLGIDIIETEVYDASVPDERYFGKADRVLLDAPCSGLGIIRRKPDIKWSKELADITGLAGLQSRLLSVASRYVKPGGVLVYSTCTVNHEENDEVVERFLKSEDGREFVPDDISPFMPESLMKGINGSGIIKAPGTDKNTGIDIGMLQLYTNRDGIDGFFIARLKRSLNSGKQEAP